MARPRKPTQVLFFTGAYRKDPQRAAARVNEPKPGSDLGPPPEELNEEQLRAWEIITSRAAPGQLTAADYPAVHVTACLYGDVLVGNRHPAIIAQLRLMLTQLGLTPAARSHVQVPEEKPGEQDSLAAI